ncbi:SDR family NAD(P)-dependent oxidoreductase [Oricola indica]|uniref:SDR family NAD(P)-dependent oxidoreductase n=1 Tax=Oricola indica TaxID=2872591 RepID=UPI003CCBCE64
MLIDLSGKTVLVTGGSSGIGRAIAKSMLDAGARVFITYLSQANDAAGFVEDARARGRSAEAFALDAGNTEAIRTLFAELDQEKGGVDILVNNAGIVSYVDFLTLEESEWDRMLNVNLKAAMLCAQLTAQSLVRRGKGGRIINISSISGQRAEPRRTHYCVSKAGMDMLTRGLALELASYGITANSVAPGTIRTNITETALSDPDRHDTIVSRTPMGRIGMPDDLAGIATFLASDHAAFITGQVIHVDGGQLL